MALLSPSITSSKVRGLSSNIWHLLLIAGLILWYGLDVVRPIKVISPDSRCGSSISCLSLLSLCISSIISTIPSYIFASSITTSISFLLLTVALSTLYFSFIDPAIAHAIDVLPIPGLPYKIIENILLLFIKFLIGAFSPTKCFWPITSSIVFGLNLSASGVFIFISPFIYNYTIIYQLFI